jgi:hypothetical protein
MNITLTGVAEAITAFGGVVTGIGTLALQIMSARRSIQNGRKIDENTALTRDTAAKVEVVHAATTAIAESTGTHQVLKPSPPP